MFFKKAQGANKEVIRKDYGSLCESIEEIKKAWQDARRNFDEITDVDSIDALIHKINSCERQYIRLLKIAQSEGIGMFPGIR